jgi:hypothetical protein
MAQRNYLRNRTLTLDSHLELDEAWGNSLVTMTATTTDGGQEIPLQVSGAPRTFQSRRLVEDWAMSGSLTLRHWSYAPSASNATIRAKLSTVSSAGIVTQLGQADAGVLPTAAGTVQTLTIPVITTDVGRLQRIYLNIFAVPVSGQTMVAGHTVSFPYNALATTTGDTALDFPDGMVWHEFTRKTVLRARRTSDAGIGTFFDLLVTRGASAATTGVVTTQSGGTQIQWTRTAGGTLLEWLSPRLRDAVDLVNDLAGGKNITVVMTGNESATAANCSHRSKVFHWRKGVETEVFSADHASEFTTSLAERIVSMITAGMSFTPMTFEPDDRIILRLYIIPVGTMGGSRTCTVSYDVNTGSVGDTRVEFDGYELFFKSETEADEAPPSNLMMGGVGN